MARTSSTTKREPRTRTVRRQAVLIYTIKANVTKQQVRDIERRADLDGISIGELVRRALDAYLHPERE